MDNKNFEAYLKKIGSGKGDSIEVVLEIENPKDQEILNLMRLRKTYVFVAVGDTQLSFELDTQADEETPNTPYTVDGSGMVEVKPNEASENVQDSETEAQEDQSQVEPKTINEFILSGQAPTFEDLPYNFIDIVTRREAGERSMDIAASLDLTSGKWSKIWKDYKGRIASAARDWDDLRNLSQVTPEYSNPEAEQSDGGAA